MQKEITSERTKSTQT